MMESPDAVNDLFASLEDTFEAVDAEHIRPLTDYTLPELIEEKSAVENEISVSGQILRPKDQRSRDLHSRLNACIVELWRREVL